MSDRIPESSFGSERPSASPAISVVVPVHDGGAAFEACLRSLAGSRFADFELIVVDDGSSDASPQRAAGAGAKVLQQSQRGPAAARNAGARVARGEILLFLDADCEIHPDALGRVVDALGRDAGLDAVFGSYDDRPAAPGIVSQFRNLLHHWTHQRAGGPARTFWAGCGAFRRRRFLDLGGFDERRYERPSVEDIELGYRLVESGGSVRLDPEIQVRHLKRWTLGSVIRTDVTRRGIPWTQLLLERHDRSGSLNTGPGQRLVVASGTLGIAALPFAPLFPPALAVTALAAAILILSSRGIYALMLRRCGVAGAAATLPLHGLYCCCCSVAFALGIVRSTTTPRKKLVLGS